MVKYRILTGRELIKAMADEWLFDEFQRYYQDLLPGIRPERLYKVDDRLLSVKEVADE